MDYSWLTVVQTFLQSLTWTDLGLVVALVLMEAALSADNAVALAALVKHLPTPLQQNRALRWGMVGAYGFRIVIVLAAVWLVEYQPARLVGAAYLLWLSWQHFLPSDGDEAERIPGNANFWQTLVLVELTDLVFSFDSIAASVAVSRKTWVIILGGIIGITVMRYMASVFLRWLDEFGRLEDAAYLIIALVGGEMLLDVILPGRLEIPEWLLISAVMSLFIWGFSQRNPSSPSAQPTIEPEKASSESALETLDLPLSPDGDPAQSILES
ncbi:MAG: DUF475 domain-containing protein [Cyanobacteriota bacterium]|nr:DUF475 domain-containing protein [Cyanobacteriota bacterium]